MQIPEERINSAKI
jgi:hypothetical protein